MPRLQPGPNVRLVAIAKAVDFNPPTVPSSTRMSFVMGITSWFPLWCCVGHQSVEGKGNVLFDIWTGPDATGIKLTPDGGGFSGYSALGRSIAYPLANFNISGSPPSYDPLSVATLFVNVTVADGVPLTANIWIIGLDMSGV